MTTLELSHKIYAITSLKITSSVIVRGTTPLSLEIPQRESPRNTRKIKLAVLPVRPRVSIAFIVAFIIAFIVVSLMFLAQHQLS